MAKCSSPRFNRVRGARSALPMWSIQARILAVAILLSWSGAARAQETPAQPMPKVLRYEEDYSYLADETRRADFWDPIKFIPLTSSKKTYLSLGGELRERFESTENPAFGLAGIDHDDVLMHRLLLSADLHIGKEFRTFIQLGNHEQIGRDPALPTDENDLDLQQGFVEGALDLNDEQHAGLRVGRQEMLFGSGRLITVREGPNIRRSFDGARAIYRSDAINLDGFLVQTVDLERGIFDDEPDHDETLWGFYGVLPLTSQGSGPHLDLYYLGTERKPAIYAAGTENEQRHTVGGRLWGIEGNVDYNVEAIYQFGEFGDADISAWGVSSDIGVAFPDLPLSPRIGLKTDAESGDDDLDDGHLKTFNPLFPNNAYFSEAALGAPMNDLDVHPNITLYLADSLSLQLGVDFLWREETEDAVYTAGLTPVPGTAGGSDAYVGNLITAHMQWRPDRHLEFIADYTHFNAGETIEQAGGEDVDFFMLSGAYRF